MIFQDGANSPAMVAFGFVGASLSSLSIKSNEEDQSYHRLLEELEAHLKEAIDHEGIEYAASCLAHCYKRSVSESEEIAETISDDVLRLTSRLYSCHGELLAALQDQGRHGKVLARYLRDGQGVRCTFI